MSSVEKILVQQLKATVTHEIFYKEAVDVSATWVSTLTPSYFSLRSELLHSPFL